MNQESKAISFIQFQLPAIAWCMFIFTVSSIPAAKIPALVNYSDKILHAGVFAVLCWLFHVAFYFQPNRSVKKWSPYIALLLTMLYGGSDEYHQMFTPGRTTEVWDFLADSAGGSIYVLLHSYMQFYSVKADQDAHS
ncbi:MAG: VanZ family protein [Ignavibacteriales bacterium]|nr:VanZ family protein [Ignavibacteriales bacterium]